MMTSSILGSALLGFDDFALAQGLEPHALMAAVSLGPGDLDAAIETRQFNQLLALCAQRSGNGLFALQFGLEHGMRGMGSLLHAIQGAHSVGEVVHALSRHSHVLGTAVQFRIERHAGSARLLYQVTDAEIPCVRQTVEWAMGMSAQLMQSLLKHLWRPQALLLQHGAAVAPVAYRCLLGVTPRFSSLENAWVFAPSLLDTRLAVQDERFMQLARQLQEELADISLQSLPLHVQRLIRNRMPHGRVTVEQVAMDLTVSPRSLQRYLLTQGTSFQALLDKTRQAVATRLIRDASISLTQVADLLGYTQLGAFSRAFSRWHGVSPQQWKRQLHQAPALDPNAKCPASPPPSAEA